VLVGVLLRSRTNVASWAWIPSRDHSGATGEYIK
jgi:hypothetical protein